MKIALDYDDTYTQDPELWLRFVKDALERNHDVRVVTMRFPFEGIGMDPRLLELVPVIFTERCAKKRVCFLQGFVVDVWIDDRPDFVLGDAAK